MASTSHRSASSWTWSSFSQLRKPGRSPSAPVSRLFCAVGCPFIWRMPGARAAEHAAQQVQVVDLHRRGRRLVGLVEALERRGHHPLAGPEDLRRPLDVARPGPADLGDPVRGVRLDDCSTSSSNPRVCASTQSWSTQPRWIDLAQQPVHQRQVGARADRRGGPATPRPPWSGAGRRRRGPGGRRPPSGPASAPTAPSASRRRCGRSGRSRHSSRGRCSCRAGRRRRTSP